MLHNSIVIECCKRVKIYLYGLKKTFLGVLDRGERDKANETGLKEEGVIEMSTTVLPLRDARSLRFEYLPELIFLVELFVMVVF